MALGDHDAPNRKQRIELARRRGRSNENSQTIPLTLISKKRTRTRLVRKAVRLGSAEKKLADGGYTLTSDRREMVTVAMRNGFAWAQRWELETSGPFTLRRRDFRFGSLPAVPSGQRRGRSTS